MFRPYVVKALGLLSVAALATLALAAGAQTSAPSAADRAFLMKVSEANIGEIAAGTLAEQRGSSSTVRLLGKRYVDNHRTNQQQLIVLARRLNVMLPMHPSAADQMAAARLKQLHGSAFDTAFLSIEQKGHMKNISAFKTEIGSSSSAPIVAYAKASLPVLEEHLQLATDDARKAPMSMNVPGTSGMDPNGSSPSINTSPATGAGQTSGAGTPSSPNDGSGTMPGSPAGPGR